MGNEFDKIESTSPAFNSSIDYLKRIDELFKRAHVFKLEKDMVSLYDILESLQIELLPRMNAEARETIKVLKKKCDFSYQMLQNPKLGAKIDAFSVKLNFFNWFAELSVTAHSLGFMMINKEVELAVFEDD